MRKKRILLNIGSEMLLQIVTIINGFLLPKFIIMAFGSSVNGLVYSITKFIGYVLIFNSGMDNIVKASLYKPLVNNDEEKINSILKSSSNFFRKFAFLICFYILLLIIFYPLIINEDFSFLYTGSLILIIGFSSFLQYYFGITYQLLLQADQKKYIVSLFQIITVILDIIVSIVLIKLGFSIHFVKLACALIFILKPFAQYLYVTKHYKINKNVKPDNEVLSQKWDSLGHHISYLVHNNTDIIMLTIFCKNIAIVSVYSVYSMILKAIEQVCLTFSIDMESVFGNMLAKKNNEQFSEKFASYETLNHFICTILFTITAIMIIPFIKVYTFGINDADYIQPIFAMLFVVAELVYCYRIPYIKLIYALGDFKNTKKAAYIEAIINVVVSLILVHNFGLIGAAIGTVLAMIYRNIDTFIYVSKNILKRPISVILKKVSFNFLMGLFLVIIGLNISFDINSYISWGIYATIVFVIVSLIILLLNYLLYKENFKYISLPKLKKH